MKILKIALFTMLLLSLFILTASARTIDVGAGYPYSDIASGVEASASGDSVHVHNGTFIITGSIMINKPLTLYGDGPARTAIYAPSAGTCNDASNTGYIVISGAHDVNVYGFTIIGPGTSAADQWNHAPTDYRSGISLQGTCTDISIHDNAAVYLYGDFIKVYGPGSTKTRILVYNNVVGSDNHDSVQLWNGVDCHIYNNYFSTINNCAVRLASCTGGTNQVDHNTMTFGYGNSGWTLVEYEGACTGSVVNNNVFLNGGDNYWAAGYWGTSQATGTVNLHDNKIYNVPAGYSLTHAGFTATMANNEVAGAIDPNWAVNGYGYNKAGLMSSMPVYNGSALPTLLSPTNGNSVSTINGNTTYSWSDVNSTSYHIYVSDNSGFTTLLYNVYSSDPSISLVTGLDTYYWKISAHDDVHNSWTANTTAFSYTTTGNTIATTGCYGEIFDTDKNTPIKGAVVSLMNGTWSSTFVTGADGAYAFSVAPSTGLYWIMASATGYQTIPESPGLPLNMTGDYVQEDIALTKSPSYFEPHYVSFRVVDTNTSNMFSSGSLLQGADIQFFAESNDPLNGVPDVEVQTGSDGIATVGISQNVNYTVITTYGVVADTEYITPVSSGYTIYLSIPSTSVVLDPFTQVTNFTVTQNVINATSAYVNVSFTDPTHTSSSVAFSLGTINSSNIFNSLNLTGTVVSGFGFANESWIVTNYMGQSYVVRANITSSTYGSVIETKTTTFPPNNLPFQGTFEFSMGCILLTLISLTMFGKWDADKALVICPLMFLVECTVGGYDGLNIYIPGASSSAMMFGTLALCYGILNYMTSQR